MAYMQNMGALNAKEWKLELKVPKKFMYRVLNVKGTKFESSNLKGMETRAKSTKIVNALGSKCTGY